VFLPDPLAYFGGCQVVVATGDSFQDGVPLRCQSVAILPQYAGYFIGGKFHIVTTYR